MAAPATADGAAAGRHSRNFCAASARKWVLAVAILGSALGFIDSSVVAIAMPAMRSGLGATLAEAQWISNAYLLPLSALILVGGAAGDRFGVARVFLVGIGIFLTASFLCALAPTAEVLIAGRALKGIGAALMVPGSLALIARAYPREERGRAIGLWAAASAMTTALGPPFGGVILSAGGEGAWRLIFALNLPVGAFIIWILLTRVHEDRAIEALPLDWAGALWASVALGLLAWALTGTGGPPAWLLALGGAMGFGAFLRREWRAAHPMIPLGLFSDLSFSAANLATFCLYAALSAILFYLPMAVITGWGVGEARMSLIFVPFTLIIAALSAPAGRLSDRVGPRPPIAVGALVVACALGLLALTFPQRDFWFRVLPLVSLMGLGMALVVSPLSNAVIGAVPEERTGTASGVNNAVSRMAGLIAIAALGTLAGVVYVQAGGVGSFGAPSAAVDHGAASDRAFAAVAWTSAALAATAACVAFAGLRQPAATALR